MTTPGPHSGLAAVHLQEPCVGTSLRRGSDSFTHVKIHVDTNSVSGIPQVCWEFCRKQTDTVSTVLTFPWGNRP